jgi:hypothetical protein
MKHMMIPVLLAASLIALSTMEAGAVVCARGVVRAGCVAAGGAAVVTTAPVVTAPVIRPVGAVVAAQGVPTGHDASGCPVNDTRQRPRLRSGERA